MEATSRMGVGSKGFTANAEDLAGVNPQDLVDAANSTKKPRRGGRGRGKGNSGDTAPVSGVRDNATRLQQEAQNADRVEQVRRELNSPTTRQARKRIRLGGKVWTDEKMAQAKLDNNARKAHKGGYKCKHHISPGARGAPFKGPSHRPPGLSQSRWQDYLAGRSPTL